MNKNEIAKKTDLWVRIAMQLIYDDFPKCFLVLFFSGSYPCDYAVLCTDWEYQLMAFCFNFKIWTLKLPWKCIFEALCQPLSRVSITKTAEPKNLVWIWHFMILQAKAEYVLTAFTKSKKSQLCLSVACKKKPLSSYYCEDDRIT